LRGLGHLAFHEVHLFAHSVAGVFENHVEIEKAGFQVAERLAEIVDQAVKDLVGGCDGELITHGRQASV